MKLESGGNRRQPLGCGVHDMPTGLNRKSLHVDNGHTMFFLLTV
jgi:hypothetical protein